MSMSAEAQSDVSVDTSPPPPAAHVLSPMQEGIPSNHKFITVIGVSESPGNTNSESSHDSAAGKQHSQPPPASKQLIASVPSVVVAEGRDGEEEAKTPATTLANPAPSSVTLSRRRSAQIASPAVGDVAGGPTRACVVVTRRAAPRTSSVPRRDSGQHLFTVSPSREVPAPREGEESSSPLASPPRVRRSPSSSQRPFATPVRDAAIPPQRAASTGRRRSSSVSVLNRTTPVASTRPLLVPNTQEELRGFVQAVLEQHTQTIAVWEERVAVAEVYRDKPTVLGGRAGGVRVADRAFLERIRPAIANHIAHLDDARSLLQRYEEEPLPAASAGDTANDAAAWRDYCISSQQTVVNLSVESRVIQVRVEKLLSGVENEHTWSTPVRSASARRGSSQGGRSRSRSGGSPSRCSTPRDRRVSRLMSGVPNGESNRFSSMTSLRSTALGSPERSTKINGDSPSKGRPVQRNNGIIRPGHNHMQQHGAPKRTGSQQPARRSLISHSDPNHDNAPTAGRQEVLHPDTVLQTSTSVPHDNTYDRSTPYGCLSPRGSQLSSRRQNGPAGVTSVSTASLQGRSADQHAKEPHVSAVAILSNQLPSQPQLRSYCSPRGTSLKASAEPQVHPQRRRQVLEVIEHYTKNAKSLQRTDLNRVREYFYELYGEQAGLQHYCDWVDDIALSLLRSS